LNSLIEKLGENLTIRYKFIEIRGYKYESVVRTRPDVLLSKPLPYPIPFSNPKQAIGFPYLEGRLICDHFALLTRAAAHVYFNVEFYFRFNSPQFLSTPADQCKGMPEDGSECIVYRK
jgi:hypothetical protein